MANGHRERIFSVFPTITWQRKRHAYWGSPGPTWHMFCLGRLWFTWGPR